MSALQVKPQATQTNSAWLLREFFSIRPQSLHRRLVYGAGMSSNAHLVFLTTYRHPVFTNTHLDRCEQIMRDVRADFGAELAEFHGDTNHVHLLVNFPPTVTPPNWSTA